MLKPIGGGTCLLCTPSSDSPDQSVKKCRIQSESGKMQTRKTPNTDIFHAVATLKIYEIPWKTKKLRKHFQTINDRCCHSIKTSQLIFRKNQLTGFYMKGKMVVSRFSIIFYQFFAEATPELFYEKGVLKNLAKFTGSTCGGVSF